MLFTRVTGVCQTKLETWDGQLSSEQCLSKLCLEKSSHPTQSCAGTLLKALLLVLPLKASLWGVINAFLVESFQTTQTHESFVFRPCFVQAYLGPYKMQRMTKLRGDKACIERTTCFHESLMNLNCIFAQLSQRIASWVVLENSSINWEVTGQFSRLVQVCQPCYASAFYRP